MKDTIALFEMATWPFDEPSQGGVVRASGGGSATNAGIDWGKFNAAQYLNVTCLAILGLISML